MSIRIRQDCTDKGNNRWKWSIWLEDTANELEQVDHVTYTLHPTFPNPVRRITTRENGFRLDSAGWGEFNIFIKIVMKDGKVSKREHWLTLQPIKKMSTSPSSPTKEEGPLGMKATAKRIAKKLIQEVADHLPSFAVYVSGGAADSEAVRILREALAKFHVRILSPEEMPSEVPLKVSIGNLLSQADVAVFLLSGRPSLWLNEEIEVALRQGVKRIVPVLVGDDAELPFSLQGYHGISINSLDDIAGLAKRITNVQLNHETEKPL